MATSKDKWDIAFDILSKFERQIISHDLFSWDYIVSNSKISKATLWRDKKFFNEFERIKDITRKYKHSNSKFDIEKSKISILEAENQKLKEIIIQLTEERDRERERLTYASMVARRHNINPEGFTELSPLTEAAKDNLKSNVTVLEDPLLLALKKKK